MKIEHLFIKHTKEISSEATTKGHQLALKGGYIHQTGAGIYTYSPLGFKVLKNIEAVIIQELDAIGCQEMNMPVISPLSLWKEAGRDNIDVLIKFKTRLGLDAVINPTHEEIVTNYAKSILQSYKQLPLSPNSVCLYQIQTKYRDELRPRAGLVRGREFMMKDAYSFHQTAEDLEAFYNIVLDTYVKIYERLGLKNVVSVLATSGDMGGQFSHEFQMINPTGEDTIFVCDDCSFRANKEFLTDKEEDETLYCPDCKAELKSVRGIEVGNIFQPADKYSKPMGQTFTDKDGGTSDALMGCYGIGVSRVMGCLFEQSENENKAIFNLEIAPYKVHIISIGEGEQIQKATELYTQLKSAGIDVIIDITDARAGSKFASADLIGAPIRTIVSAKTLEKAGFEMKYSGLDKDYSDFLEFDKALTQIENIVKGL